MQTYLLASCICLCFQITFPPNIYYKIFTHRPIADVCASSPKDYTQLGLKKPVARQTNNGSPLMLVDRSGWYQRMENNSWRLFCSKVKNVQEIILCFACHLSKYLPSADAGKQVLDPDAITVSMADLVHSFIKQNTKDTNLRVVAGNIHEYPNRQFQTKAK